MKKVVLVGMLLLLIACQPVVDEIDVVTDTDGTKDKQIIEAPEAQETPSVQVYQQNIGQLLERGKKRTSYHYVFGYKVRDSFGNYREEAGYEVFVQGDKVRKSYLEPRRLDLELFYDNIYLDNTAGTAVATCVKRNILCESSYEKVYTAEFEELPFTAIDLLEKVPPEANIVGDRSLYGRSALLIEYGRQRMYIDTYYGLPLKHEVFKIENGEEIILEESTFTRLSIDVKDSDMSVPEEYVLVNS